MTIATATEVQNNFGIYIQLVQTGGEVIVMKNGKEVARLISYDKGLYFLTDSLIGVVKGDYDEKEIRRERMQKNEGDD